MILFLHLNQRSSSLPTTGWTIWLQTIVYDDHLDVDLNFGVAFYYKKLILGQDFKFDASK